MTSQHLCGHAEFGSYTGQVILMPPEFLKDRWPTGIGIDVCLALEIQSLWQKGIKTLEHCCGHGRKEGYIAVADECVSDMLSLGYVKTDHESGFIFLPKTVLQSRTEQESVAYTSEAMIKLLASNNADYGASYLMSKHRHLSMSIPLYTSPPDQSARIAELDDLEEVVAKIIHDEDETFDTTWPESPDDDGHRGGGGYVRLVSDQDAQNLRHTASLIIKAVQSALHNKLKEK